MNENEMKTDIRTREIKPRRGGTHWRPEIGTTSGIPRKNTKNCSGATCSPEKTCGSKPSRASFAWRFMRLSMRTGNTWRKMRLQDRHHMAMTWTDDEHMLFEEGLRMVENLKLEREETLRRNLEKAQKAARCRHRYLNGRQCGAPRVKGRKLCHMHERVEEAKMAIIDLGPMEDADSIQMGIRKLQAAIVEGKLSHRQIAQLAYTIQLAAWNVTRTSVMAEKLE